MQVVAARAWEARFENTGKEERPQSADRAQIFSCYGEAGEGKLRESFADS